VGLEISGCLACQLRLWSGLEVRWCAWDVVYYFSGKSPDVLHDSVVPEEIAHEVRIISVVRLGHTFLDQIEIFEASVDHELGFVYIIHGDLLTTS
jgi:hypothetical protein